MQILVAAFSLAATAATALAAQTLPRGQVPPKGLLKPFHEIAFVRVSSSLDAPIYADPTDLNPRSEPKNAIFLIRPDGRDETKLYGSNAPISFLDLKPGGGEIAFIEGATVKRLHFNTLGSPVGSVTQIPMGWGLQTCVPVSLDYHPTNGTLLVAGNCAGVLWAKTDALMQFREDGTMWRYWLAHKKVTSARWRADGKNYVYLRTLQPGDSGPAEGGSRIHWTANHLSHLAFPQNEVPGPFWQSADKVFDTARHSELDVVRSYLSEGRSMVRSGSPYSNLAGFRGSGGHYSADDQQLLYKASCADFACRGPARGLQPGSALVIRTFGGGDRRLTPIGIYGASDWRK